MCEKNGAAVVSRIPGTGLPEGTDVYPGESWWEQLVGGTVSHGSNFRRVIVVESLALVPRVLASGLVRSDSLLLARDNTSPPAPFRFPDQPGSLLSYAGSFVSIDNELALPDWVFDVRSYGLAQFSTITTPTVLRIVDEADFSAFLRDADRAFFEGVFVEHMTNPQVVLADSVGLGDDPSGAGPTNRLFVFPDGSLSISPAGRVLGDIDDPLSLLDTRWRTGNRESERPCAVCLSRVIDERDRTDALNERDWLPRYLVVARAVRLARRHGQLPSRVSGFGGRMAETSTIVDDRVGIDETDAPIILGGHNGYWVQDSTQWLTEPLSVQEVRRLEQLLVTLASSRALDQAGEFFAVDAATTAMVDRLSARGIASAWFDRSVAGSGQEHPVSATPE